MILRISVHLQLCRYSLLSHNLPATQHQEGHKYPFWGLLASILLERQSTQPVSVHTVTCLSLLNHHQCLSACWKEYAKDLAVILGLRTHLAVKHRLCPTSICASVINSKPLSCLKPKDKCWPTHIDFEVPPRRIKALQSPPKMYLVTKEASISWQEIKREIEPSLISLLENLTLYLSGSAELPGSSKPSLWPVLPAHTCRRVLSHSGPHPSINSESDTHPR